EYGSINGVGVRDRQIRDRWMADGTAEEFGVLANAWKETVRDAISDIAASSAAAKVKVRRAVRRHTDDESERKRLCSDLKYDRWRSDPYLRRQMRRYWRRALSRVSNQIIVRPDQYRTFTLTAGGNLW